MNVKPSARKPRSQSDGRPNERGGFRRQGCATLPITDFLNQRGRIYGEKSDYS
jgi:hypothetical protein